MKRYWEFQHQRVNPLRYFIIKKKNSKKEDLWNMGEGVVASTLTSIPFVRPLAKREKGGGGGDFT